MARAIRQGGVGSADELCVTRDSGLRVMAGTIKYSPSPSASPPPSAPPRHRHRHCHLYFYRYFHFDSHRRRHTRSDRHRAPTSSKPTVAPGFEPARLTRRSAASTCRSSPPRVWQAVAAQTIGRRHPSPSSLNGRQIAAGPPDVRWAIVLHELSLVGYMKQVHMSRLRQPAREHSRMSRASRPRKLRDN